LRSLLDAPPDWLAFAGKSPIARQLIGQAVEAALRVYVETGRPAHFWRAWTLARRVGLEIPERMLLEVDKLAAATAELDSPAVNEEAAQAERLQDLWIAACRETGQPMDVILRPELRRKVLRHVARKHGVSTAALAMQWSRAWGRIEASRKRRRFDEVRSAWWR
jgi:hypothetical protein